MKTPTKSQNLSAIFQRLLTKYGRTQVVKPAKKVQLPQVGSTAGEHLKNISALRRQVEQMQSKK